MRSGWNGSSASYFYDLVNPALKPGFTSIYSAHLYFKDILRIRKSKPLFRLQTGDAFEQRVKFYNVGPNQQPALIVMAISDKVGRKLDPNAKSILVLFNVDKIAKTNQPARVCRDSPGVASDLEEFHC